MALVPVLDERQWRRFCGDFWLGFIAAAADPVWGRPDPPEVMMIAELSEAQAPLFFPGSCLSGRWLGRPCWLDRWLFLRLGAQPSFFDNISHQSSLQDHDDVLGTQLTDGRE